VLFFHFVGLFASQINYFSYFRPKLLVMPFKSTIEKNNKRTIFGWSMYDWANSVYSLVITTAIFPAYYYGVSGGSHAEISIFGTEINNTVVYTWSLSIAFLFVAMLNPILSSLADVSGNKKRFMQFFCFLGAISCSSLFFFTKNNLFYGLSMFMLAGVGWAGSLVFYNSFLPEITTEENFDKVSAKGFSLGYIGSVILLIINLIMVQMPGLFDFEDSEIAARFSFLTVGLWWFGFSLITFSVLPNRSQLENKEKDKTKKNVFSHAINEYKKVIGEIKQLPLLKKFLMSFLFYSMGVQTVMYIATIFGTDVVKMKMDELIILVLILQLVAIGGAYLFSKISAQKGNIFAIKISLLIWAVICVCAYFMKEGMVNEFYILGVFVGLMMGAIQSMSRSTYAKLMPQETTDHASYFSFYETIEKFSIAIGSLVFGIINALMHSMNYSALALCVFFLVGFIFIHKIPSQKIYNTSLKK
jgi:MFS transporter, UMF1 family